MRPHVTDEDRLMRLEDDMKRALIAIAEMRASVRAWAIIISLVLSPAITIFTNWVLHNATQPAAQSEDLKEVRRLLEDIRRNQPHEKEVTH